MTNLIANPIGYQHEPQDSAHINHQAILTNVICRLALKSNDENAGYLDQAIRVFPAIPNIGDTVTLTGAMLSQTINLRILDVLPQDEALVQRAGGPVYVLDVITI